LSNNAIVSRIRIHISFAIQIAIFSLVSCGGNGSSSSKTDTPITATYTITASSDSNGSVTPAGTTTVTQGGSQSYTITPDAGYAIAALTIDGTAVATSSTHTFANVRANHTISATFGAALPGGIALSLVPSRTSGVAPLSVFFDASGTTDTGVTTRPFHDLEYTWSFGDSSSGTWTYGAQPGVSSKNSATGPVAAHVFETPGTYTVSVTAFDGTNTATTTTTITVTDPDTVFSGANTTCFSTSGTFTGCPTGATHITTSDFVTAIGYQTSSRRLLFRRGEAFTSASAASITVAGPGLIGAYGTGAAPMITKTAINDILIFSSPSTPTLSDWRLMNLNFSGNNYPTTGGDFVHAVSAEGSVKNLTILNMIIREVEYGVVIDAQVLDLINVNNPGHTMFDGISIADSVISPIQGLNSGWRAYISAERVAIIGNNLGVPSGTVGGSHIIRTPYVGKGVIANNDLQRSPAFLNIKMHGPPWCQSNSPEGVCICPNYCEQAPFRAAHAECDDQSSFNYINNIHPIGIYAVTSGYTEKVVVSGNRLYGDGSTYITDFGPQNALGDERVRDVIIEKNYFQAANGITRSELVTSGEEITIRNNLFNLTGGANGRFAVNVRRAGGGTTSPAPFPDHIRIYNNTIYASDTASGLAGFLLEENSQNVTISNNLIYAPMATSPKFIDDTRCASGCFAASNNSTDSQIKNNSPLFTATPPVLMTDWKPTTGSYAINGGTLRPQNSAIDIGAIE
jgi:hypothetical protein